MRELQKTIAGRYGLAAVSALLAVLLRLLLDPVLGDAFPFATLFFAVLFSSWWGGTGAGLAAAILGALLASRYLLAPRDSLQISGFDNQAGIVLYLATSLGIAWLGGAMRAARERAEALAEAAARQREELRTTLHSIGDAVIVTDREGLVRSLNPVAEALTGWSLRTAAGQPLHMVFRIISESTRLPVEDPVTKVLRSGAVVGLANHTILVARDGRERSIDDSAAPIRNAQGEITGVVLVFRDISDRRQADQAVQGSEATLRLALEAGQMGVWDWNIMTNAISWSHNLEALHGLPNGSFAGTFEAFQQLIHPEDRPRVSEAITNALEQTSTYDIEFRTIWPDRSVHWMAGKGLVVRDQQGRPQRMIGVGLDVTRRKQLEEQLLWRLEDVAEAEARMRSVVDRAGDGIITIDDRGSIDSFNPAAEEIFATRAADVIGRSIASLIDQPWETWQIGSQIEVTGRRQDGLRVPLELAVGEFFVGNYRYLTAIVRDITERKRTERNMRFLADSSAALADLVDYEATLQKVAQLAVPEFADWCAIDAFDDQDQVRRLAVAHVDPAKIELAHQLHRRFPPDPQANHGVLQIRRTGQSEMIAQITDELLATTVADPERLAIIRELGLRSYLGVPLSVRGKVVAVMTFITAESGKYYTVEDLRAAEDLARRAAVAIENAQLYQALREADRQKDDFLAILAHELRNPLAPIANALQILKISGADRATQQQARDMAERQLQQLTRLVDDLLDVSRILRGKIELRRAPVRLSEVVQRAVETARPLIEASRHNLAITLPEHEVYLQADEVRLAQALSNLLNNSAKYTEAGGQISLAAVAVDGQVTMSVRDSGIGIAGNMLARVFQPFAQAPHSTSRAQGGLGIGLTLVKNLVELHGGRVSVQSAGMGKGSEFTVTLPVLPAAPAATELPSGDAGAKKPAGRRILVVDDNVDAGSSLGMLLKLSGHSVRVVHSGEAALEAVAAEKPQFILLDIGMPGMDGYEVARRLRQVPDNQGIKICALTGWGQEQDRRRSQQAGFDLHLTKPVELATLQKLLAEQPASV